MSEQAVQPAALPGMREMLIAADSLLSLIANRYGSALPDDLRAEVLAASRDCRRVAENPLRHVEDVEIDIEWNRRWGS